MRRYVLLLAVPLVLAAGCGSSSDNSTHAGTAGGTSTTTLPPATPGVSIVSPTANPGPADPAAPTGTIAMVKLFVDDLEAGQKFYGAVFGAKLAVTMGDAVHIVTFPKGGPGLVLIKKGPDDQNKYGAFIIQVPNRDAAQSLALANGATLQREYAGAPGGQASKSVDLLDPWGNQVEILQVG